MKPRSIIFLTILLALSVVHTGFAQNSLLQCKNRCEQYSFQQTKTLECCRGIEHADHSFAQNDDQGIFPGGCPHADSNRKISDFPSFLSSLTKVPAPNRLPAFAGIVVTPLVQLHDIQSRSFLALSGLFPPTIASPPAYRLYCSLLI